MEKAIFLFLLSVFVLLGLIKLIELVLELFNVKGVEPVFLICAPKDDSNVEFAVRSFCIDIEKINSDKKTAIIIDDNLSEEGKKICRRTVMQFNNALICSSEEAKKICAV